MAVHPCARFADVEVDGFVVAGELGRLQPVVIFAVVLDRRYGFGISSVLPGRLHHLLRFSSKLSVQGLSLLVPQASVLPDRYSLKVQLELVLVNSCAELLLVYLRSNAESHWRRDLHVAQAKPDNCFHL
jgi:hypothetical protein